MRSKLGRLILATMLLSVAVREASAELRQIINFNREWKFQLGDVTAADAAAFDESKWDNANLPHSFSTPYFAADEKFYVGYGWYRKHFEVPRSWSGKRINLEFDGVFQMAELFVNGRRIGEHKGGYTGFAFDITEAVKPGDNVVAMRVNNIWDPRLAPRAGEHVFSGGIYRDVRMVVTSPLHVAWYGTFVTTPQVSKESGTVNVKTEVVNESTGAKTVTVKTSVLDAQGKTVAQMESSATLGATASNVFDQTSAAIANPNLWTPARPNLYSVKTVVLDGRKAVDDYTSPLGFRWFKFTADQGFFLNGEHYYFKGANVHQDHAGWGDAVADSGFFRDVRMVKDAGMDFIRGSHYPHAPAFSQACDQLGILFWSENCFWATARMRSPWGASGYPTDPADEAEFEASVKASLRDMIRIHRNHPSIIVWSMCNEPFFSSGSVMPKVRSFLKELVACTRELDSTRPAAIGGCQRGDTDKLGDIAGYNGDGARLFINPGIPSVVTEYGSTQADRPGRYEPGWGDLPSTTRGTNQNDPASWRLPWRSGEALWCAFDHGSIAGRRFGAMGFVDYFRLPKRQWYWYRDEYLHIPPPAWPSNGIPAALNLSADKTSLDAVDGTDDTQIIVTVVDRDSHALNNCPPVTLAIESGPGEFPTGPSITFASDSDITIRDGQAAMEFRSYYAGKTLIRATSPGLKDATIQITSRGGPKFVKGKTPSVTPRPYVRYTGAAATNELLVLGRENPTRASSEAPGHSGRMANDGSTATFWQANPGDTNAWLMIDLERIVTATRVKVVFPSSGNWRYRIEISDDGSAGWKLVSDQREAASTTATQVTSAASGARGRFLLVSVSGIPEGKPPAIAEVELTGTLSTQ